MKLKYKLNLVPFISTLLLVAIIFLSMKRGEENSSIFTTIESKYIPSIILVKEIENGVQNLQQSLMNAGISGDEEKLLETDSLYNTILTSIHTLDSLTPVRNDEESLEKLFISYYGAAIPVTKAMIKGDFSEAIMKQSQEMNETVNTLKEHIAKRDGNIHSSIDQSFSTSNSLLHEIINFLKALFVFSVIALIGSIFVTSLVTGSIKNAGNRLREMAQGEGDLTQRLRERGRDETSELAHWFNEFVSKIALIVKTVQEDSTIIAASTQELSSISIELNKNSEDLQSKSRGSSDSAQSIKQSMIDITDSIGSANEGITSVSAATEELNASIHEITHNTENAQKRTREALSKADDSSVRVKLFAEKTDEIGRIIDTIDMVARQTDLLAVNAAIEAVAAGQYGKGFTVVAQEVKSLAAQSNKAATSITHIIKSVQESIETTTTDIEEIRVTIQELDNLISAIAGALNAQNATTDEISNNMITMTAGLHTTTNNIGIVENSISSMAENSTQSLSSCIEVNEGSTTIKESTNDLREISERLIEMVGKFTV